MLTLLRRTAACDALQPARLGALLTQAASAPQYQARHDPGPASTSCGQQSVRSFNVRAAAGSLYKGISDLLNLPSIMYPDIYNQQEKQAADTYKFYGKVMHPYYRQQAMQTWNLYANGNEGWDELERRTRYFWNRVWAQRVCRQSVWGFSSRGLKEHAIRVYREVNAAVAQGHKGKLALEPIKELVVPTLLDQMQGEATRLQQSGRQVEWRMVKEPTLKDVKIVNGYLIKAVNNPQVNVKLHFVQWTLEIRSEQTFAVKQGPKVLSGDTEKPIQVVDYWVFERPVFKSWFIPKPGPRGATWRLVARLTQPEGRPPALRAAPV